MIFEKYLFSKSIISLILGIIPFIVASDCDILKNSLSHIKGDVYTQHKFLTDCCNTSTVTCDSSNQITEINISNYELPIADFKSALKELSGLTNLNKLSITNNNIPKGIILPEEIGNISNLKTLIISKNTIDNNINNLSTIPESIGNLKNLEELNISNTNISGTIPKSLSNLKLLKSLWLNDNQLTGSIPVEIKELTNLEILNLKNNHLDNIIPSEIIEFTSNLKTFDYTGQTERIESNNSNANSFEVSNSNTKIIEPSLELKPNKTKIILIIICSIIVLLILIVVIVYFIKRNRINKNGKKNVSSNFERNESISIVVNKNGKLESPSENQNNNIYVVDITNLNKTSENPITTSPSSSQYNNNNNNNIDPNIDLIKNSQPSQAQAQAQLQQFEQELQQQELQLQQQLEVQKLQLQQIKLMKNKLHHFQQNPPSLSSEQKSDEKSKGKGKETLQENEKENPPNTHQNSPIRLTHNVIPINASAHILSRNNNSNHQNQNYSSTIDYDESPPSYNDVVNN